MLYHWYEAGHAAVHPMRVAARATSAALQNPFNPFAYTHAGRHTVAALEVFERTTRRYEKPEYRVKSTVVDGVSLPVKQQTVWEKPFCKLESFIPEGLTEAEIAARPNIFLAAPMSGHHATLLRGTIEALLPEANIFITDWVDARKVPKEIKFDLDDATDYYREMMQLFKGDVSVFAVCQPSVPVLAALALMEQDGEKTLPYETTFAGGPIDTRKSPTVVNKLATEKGTDWFRRNVIAQVPWPHEGHGRHVYPGFLQLTGFMTMNLDRHVSAHKDLFHHLVQGDGDGADKHREFYDEYLAVMDLTEEFYMQTVDRVFVNHLLPKGEYVYRPNTPQARAINLKSIQRPGLLTIEGEKDDITGIGQCSAAQDLVGIPAGNREHFECPKVGHYGVFNGSRFRREIATKIIARAKDHRPRIGHDPHHAVVNQLRLQAA